MSLAVTEGIPCFPLLTKDKRTFIPSISHQSVDEKRAEQHKFVFLDVEFSEIRTKREKHFLFTLPGYRRSRLASLFHQEKMLIINLRLLATSLFNG